MRLTKVCALIISVLMKTSDSWQTEHSIQTSAAPERIWAIFQDVPGWKRWNAGIEQIELEGPFATGTWFSMTPPGQEALRTKLIDVRDGEHFIDETRVGDLVITVAHRIERVTGNVTRIVYAVEAKGPGAAEIGPAIAADFPEVLAALAALAEVAS
jgi:hypothetical protein